MNATPFDRVTGAVAAFVVATAPGCDDEARDRLWRSIAGRSSVEWTLTALADLESVQFCALIVPHMRSAEATSLLQAGAGKRPTGVALAAGLTWNDALAAIAQAPNACEWVMILDAALPLVTSASLRSGLQAARTTGVAIASEPVKETLKRVRDDRVTQTPDRGALRRLLTPVVLQREAARDALSRLRDSPAGTGDLFAFAQLADRSLTAFDAGYLSLRATSTDDLPILEALLRQRLAESEHV